MCCDCHEKEHTKQPKQIEVIPEQYKEVIFWIEKCNRLNKSNIDHVAFILKAYIEYIEDEDFLSNLAHVCNSGYLEKLKYDIMAAANDEKNSILLSILDNKVKKLEEWNNGLWLMLGNIADHIEAKHPEILKEIRNIKLDWQPPK